MPSLPPSKDRSRAALLTCRHSLFIDVWAPSNATADSRLPVKVWLYGGGNQAGGISNPLYDACFAATNTVQVSINYRVGPLGFFALESMGLGGNQGLQDQLLGLRWVQDNVAAFGGDPTRVLLFGQSAGAADAFVISTLPQAKDLFQSVILESGLSTVLPTLANASASNEQVVGLVNCSTSDVACLRAAPISALNAATAATTSDTARGLVLDGQVVAEQPVEVGVQVPAVVGSTAKEGSLFILSAFQTSFANLGPSDYDTFLRGMFGPAAASRIRETYPLAMFNGSPNAAFDAMSAALTYSTFRCPARRVLDRAAANGVPVWTYSFNRTVSCAWYAQIPALDPVLQLLGPAHTAEIPYVFGQVADLPRPFGQCNLTEPERAIGRRLRAAWDGMAAAASPGDDWPPYTPDASRGVNIQGDSFDTADVVDYSMCDFWDAIADMAGSGSPGGNATAPVSVSDARGRTAPAPFGGGRLMFLLSSLLPLL